MKNNYLYYIIVALIAVLVWYFRDNLMSFLNPTLTNGAISPKDINTTPWTDTPANLPMLSIVNSPNTTI